MWVNKTAVKSLSGSRSVIAHWKDLHNSRTSGRRAETEQREDEGRSSPADTVVPFIKSLDSNEEASSGEEQLVVR
jgi:hypothetical protein